MINYGAYLYYFNAFIDSIVVFLPTRWKSVCVGYTEKEERHLVWKREKEGKEEKPVGKQGLGVHPKGPAASRGQEFRSYTAHGGRQLESSPVPEYYWLCRHFSRSIKFYLTYIKKDLITDASQLTNPLI